MLIPCKLTPLLQRIFWAISLCIFGPYPPPLPIYYTTSGELWTPSPFFFWYPIFLSYFCCLPLPHLITLNISTSTLQISPSPPEFLLIFPVVSQIVFANFLEVEQEQSCLSLSHQVTIDAWWRLSQEWEGQDNSLTDSLPLSYWCEGIDNSQLVLSVVKPLRGGRGGRQAVGISWQSAGMKLQPLDCCYCASFRQQTEVSLKFKDFVVCTVGVMSWILMRWCLFIETLGNKMSLSWWHQRIDRSTVTTVASDRFIEERFSPIFHKIQK